MSKLYRAVVILAIGAGLLYVGKSQIENYLLKKIIDRLTADSRVAEVVVTDARRDPETQKMRTTIRFVEYDTRQRPLSPKYFTFSNNLIQFQSMVLRFDDVHVKNGHPLKGKSAYLFMKAFYLAEHDAEVFQITKMNEVPEGYDVNGAKNIFEQKLWEKFWEYALNPEKAETLGIKNAQIEAPGTRFIPGMIYIIKIEHDGGLRIDAKAML